MDTDTKVFRDPGPTLGAELRGVSGRDFDDCSGSLFRFPAQYTEETEPSRISHRPVERCGRIPCIHPLNADGIIVAYKLIGQLKVEIPSLVGDFLMGLGHQHTSFRSAVRAFNPLREPLLPHGKNIPGLLKEAGIAHLHSIRGSQEGLKPNIDTHRSISWGKWFQGHIITGKAGIPFTGGRAADSDCLDYALDGTGQPELEDADIPDGEIFSIQLPASLLQREGVVAILSLKPREACFAVPILNTAKEPLVSSVKTLKDILKHLRAYITVFREGLLEVREFFLLLKGRDGTAVTSVGSDTLLKGTVVEMVAQRKPPLGAVNGLRAGLNSILKRFLSLHTCIIATLKGKDKPYRALPSVSPALKCGVLDGGML